MPQFPDHLSVGKDLFWQNKTKSTVSIANLHNTEKVTVTGCFLTVLKVLLLFWDLWSDGTWYKYGPKVKAQQMKLWFGHGRWEEAVTAGLLLWPPHHKEYGSCATTTTASFHSSADTVLSLEKLSKFFLKPVSIWPIHKWVSDCLFCGAKGSQLQCCPYHPLVFCWLERTGLPEPIKPVNHVGLDRSLTSTYETTLVLPSISRSAVGPN